MLLRMSLQIFIGFTLGLIINYIADVLPSSRRLTYPVCRKCQNPFPLKSYLFGRSCPACGQTRKARFFIIIILSIALSILLSFFQFANLSYWAALPLLVYFGVIVVIDMEHRLVLFETTLFGFVLLSVYGILLRGVLPTFFGALGGFFITFLFYWLGIGFTKLMGRLRGQTINTVAFGFGDVSLGTVLGLLTGWPGILGAIIIALLSFGVFSLLYLLVLLATKRYKSFASALPFAPFLVLGVIVMYYL